MASIIVTAGGRPHDEPVEGTLPLDEHVLPQRSPSSHREGDLVGGRYRVDGLLARGGMADVYAATELPLQRPVALKISTVAPLQAGAAAERLLHEARLMASLHHVSITAVLDHGRTPAGAAFLVLERVDGPTLREFIEQTQSISWRMAATIAMQIALGLSAAHRQRIVHCDLSPSNVLLAHLQANGIGTLCKLIDFGIACGAGEARQPPLHGTRRYVAPEARRGGRAHPRMDLYALGVILAEMLAKSAEHPPQALLGLSQSLVAADPGRRPRSAAAVVEALRRIAHPASGAANRRRAWMPAHIGWAALGVGGLFVLGALTSGERLARPRLRPDPVETPPRAIPPAVHAALQNFPVHVQSRLPELASPPPSPEARPRPGTVARRIPARRIADASRPTPRSALEAALREHDADLTPHEIHLDPSGQSARVVYHETDARRGVQLELVEYWALSDGHWRPLDRR